MVTGYSGEFIQEMWDRYLLTCFFRDFGSAKNRQMRWMASDFMAATGIESLDGIKRAPRDIHHMRCGISRFVCGYLPRLARVLIDGGKSIDDVPDLVQKMKRWTIDTLRSDPIADKDRAECRKASKEFLAHRMGSAAIGEHYRETSRQFNAHGIKQKAGRPL